MTTIISTDASNSEQLLGRQPVLKILGMGGGGSNAVNRMIELGLKGVEFIAANTDLQALNQSLAPTKLALGPRTTRGLGAGGDPRRGEEAAEESFKDLCEVLRGADMVFLTAGMGGGTGTGSIPVAARAAREVGAVTVAIVTMPFTFEMGRRQRNAREGMAKLQPYADTLVTVPNDQLLKVAPPNTTLDMALRLADDVLRQGVQGISEIITQPGMINVDFAHVRSVMKMGGGSLLSIGIGSGEQKALKAIEHALHHPMLESISIEEASAIVANFTGGNDLTFMEMVDAMQHLQDQTHNRAEVIPGVITDPRMNNRVQVILLITGLGATPMDARSPFSPRPVKVQEPVLVSAGSVENRANETIASGNQDLPAFMRRRIH